MYSTHVGKKIIRTLRNKIYKISKSKNVYIERLADIVN